MEHSMKTIVVTGASKGIGRAIALTFAERGWRVFACARGSAALEELKKDAAGFSGFVYTFVCDASVKEQLADFAAFVFAHTLQIDVLVNNAGVFIPGRVIDEAEGNLEKLMNTNLYSAYHLSRLLIPAMLQRGQGHIFNVSSVAGVQAYPNGGSYSISKFALRGLSMALREELKEHNIRVTTLLPGATLTDSWAGVNLPAERFMKAEDIAQTVWDIHHLSNQTVVEEVLLRPMKGDI